MPVRHGCINAALVRFPGLVSLTNFLISSRKHAVSVSFVVRKLHITVQGGDQLEVSFKENNGGFADVKLTGPAEFVFEGNIEI